MPVNLCIHIISCQVDLLREGVSSPLFRCAEKFCACVVQISDFKPLNYDFLLGIFQNPAYFTIIIQLCGIFCTFFEIYCITSSPAENNRYFWQKMTTSKIVHMVLEMCVCFVLENLNMCIGQFWSGKTNVRKRHIFSMQRWRFFHIVERINGKIANGN